MVSGKSEERPTKPPLGPNRAKPIKKKKKQKTLKSKGKSRIRNNKKSDAENKNKENGSGCEVETMSASQQLSFFLDEFQSANGVQISSLEFESIKDSCILELSCGLDQESSNLGKHIKAAFESSWKEVLCEGQLLEGQVEPGSPAVLIISASALRSLELLRSLRPLTRECAAAKLFSKHMKVEDQVSLLKNRINIGSGTPSRIKKLIDIEALGLLRLSLIVLDMHVDVKGYSLFTLPQVRDEFWDLYSSYFHQRLVQGNLRICLYGPTRAVLARKKRKGAVSEAD